MAKTFILSDGSVNSYGFSVDMTNLHLERFRNNPVMLYNHYDLIGKWENLRVEDGKLLAEASFMDGDGEALAKKVEQRVEKGYVKGASLGFRVVSVLREKDKDPLLEVEIFECSVCDVPANARAMVLYNKDGIKLEGKAFDTFLQLMQKGELTKNGEMNFGNKKSEMKLSLKSYEFLGLEEGADAVAVDGAITLMQAEHEQMKHQLKAIQEEKVTTLISRGLADGRILGDKKGQFEQLARTDFDLAKQLIEALPPKETLSGKENRSSGQDRADWTHKKWREKDTAGLLKIKAADPERYGEILTKESK